MDKKIYENYDYYGFPKKENIFLKFLKKVGKAILERLFNMFISILLFFIFLIIVLFFIFSFKNNVSVQPSLSKVYLEIGFSKGIKETPSTLISKNYISLYEVIGAIEAAKSDSNIKGIILNLDNILLSSEKTDEIGKKITEFKEKTKKRVYAFGNYITVANYKLALYSDEIYMTPSNSALFSLEGYSIIQPYFRNLADKIGVKFNVIHIGDFKTYGENFYRNNMSNELKQELTRVYDSVYKRFTEKISINRKIPLSELQSGIENGEFTFLTPFEAKNKKFIDEVMEYDEFLKKIGAQKDKTKNIISINNYVQNLYSKYIAAEPRDKIAVIFAEGNITMSQENDDTFNNENINPQKISELIDMVINDETVKGVIIRVNSPGGSALASEIILKKIEKLKMKKTVFVSMGEVAASGGYYISSKADKIYAEKSTITGSIGVVSILPNFKGLTDKIGVNFDTIKYGKYGDIGNSVRETTQDEIEVFRNSMLKTYAEFKKRVSEGRKIDLNNLEEIAQGKIWTGEEAVKIGLVDKIGGLDDAIKDLAELKKLKNYDVITVLRPINFLDMVKHEIINNITVKTNLKVLENNKEIDEILKSLEKFDKFNKYESLMLMPYSINSGV